jgi:hypothetical protein
VRVHFARPRTNEGDTVKAIRISLCAAVALGLSLTANSAFARGAVEGPIVYVESQDLFYDSIVTAMELPPRGPFQQLYPCDFGLCTEFGPGDPGHRGGRWWVDDNRTSTSSAPSSARAEKSPEGIPRARSEDTTQEQADAREAGVTAVIGAGASPVRLEHAGRPRAPGAGAPGAEGPGHAGGFDRTQR